MSKSNLDILHEDNDLIIVNKPASMLTIPDRFKPLLPNVLGELKKKYGEVFIVHRLDRETSGVLCFARNAAAHRHLSMQFEKHTPTKVYWLLVEGAMETGAEGLIDAALGEDESRAGSMRVVSKGKPSMTEYKAVSYFRHYTVVEATPRTGRTHQLRVHFAHIGHPPAVDALYGQHTALYLSEIKQRKFNLKKHSDEQALLSRVPLHALSLTVLHPTTLVPVTFTAPLPKDLYAVHQQLGKWDAIKSSPVL